MIQKVRIQNFKSVLDLELELGRVNVFIGENGSGKTSVLEGIAMGSAASQDKLDYEFLGSRGLRMVEPNLMRSAFSHGMAERPVVIRFTDKSGEILDFSISEEDSNSSNWLVDGVSLPDVQKFEKDVLLKIQNLREQVSRFREETTALIEISEEQIDERIDAFQETMNKEIDMVSNSKNKLLQLRSAIKTLVPFLLYAPENHFLRRFEEEGQIRPLGIRGEGLFRHLTELAKEAPETLARISEELKLIDWFEGFSIPNDLQFTERRIAITDRFIKDIIAQIDQRSANEGFLYLLFYFTLFLSKYTPSFFAIDNIDNALNPRLCAKLVETLVKLAKENDKQAIFTTHNPAVLDGLDLEDEEQRLFVIYRNADGETKARRVKAPRKVEGVETPRLSEAFVRGYLGGLPQNF